MTVVFLIVLVRVGEVQDNKESRVGVQNCIGISGIVRKEQPTPLRADLRSDCGQTLSPGIFIMPILELLTWGSAVAMPNLMDRYPFTISPDHFLALLDYVSRAHEIEIRPPSIRPSVASIICEVNAWIFFKF